MNNEAANLKVWVCLFSWLSFYVHTKGQTYPSFRVVVLLTEMIRARQKRFSLKLKPSCVQKQNSVKMDCLFRKRVRNPDVL